MKIKTIPAVLLSAAIAFASITGVCAAPTPSPAPEGDGQSADASTSIFLEDDGLTAPKVTGEAALLMDMKTGRVLYSKNPRERLYPASTTKIMTGILALEQGNMADVVTAGVAPLATITNEDSHMGILIGEQLTMEQLVNGMLVHSANDAANVIAYHIAGGMDEFVERMNKKAQELGAVNTHFKNACGIHDDDHYTTAEDLSIIARYAMQNEKFREIVKTTVYRIPPTNKYTTERVLSNTNLLISKVRSTYHLYAPATGIKTGFTSMAGSCLVASAEYNGTELLSVVMKCNNENNQDKARSYIDTKAMFEFGFNSYQYDVLNKAGDVIREADVYEAKGNKKAVLTITEDLSALLPVTEETQRQIETEIELPARISAPIQQNQVIGKITYTIKGSVVGSANLVAAEAVERNNLLFIAHITINILSSPFFYIPVVLLIILLLIRRKRKQREERRNRLRKMRRRPSMQSEDKSKHTDAARMNAKYKTWDNKQNPNSRYKKD